MKGSTIDRATTGQRRILALCLTALIASASPLTANVMIVRARGQGQQFIPGRFLPDNYAIKLIEGQRVELLDKNGIRVLNGPGSFTASGTGPDSSPGIAALLVPREPRISRGGSRPADIERGISDLVIWPVDVEQGGDICLPGNEYVTFSRPSRDRQQKVRVRTAANEVESVEFPLGTQIADWPVSSRPSTGDVWNIEEDGQQIPIRWHIITPPTDYPTLKRDLALAGCQHQSTMLEAILE